MFNKRSEVLRLVGIGASAGGLDALTRFLPMLKPDGRTVYVIAQHMARNNPVDSVLSLLRRQSALPVVVATNNVLLVENQVFLIPSGVTGVVQQGRIQLLPVTSDQISSPSVNALFNSIAQETKHAVGIILSGAGNDGLSGCRSIKAQGGKIIAQTLESSQMTGMPGVVIDANLADEILLPEEIAQALDNKNYFSRTQGQTPIATDIFKHLLKEILATTGIDFSNYKEETLLRRLQRRMAMLKIASLPDYQIYTQKYPEELHKLQHQFLISLSAFFRDSESFIVLKQYVNELIKHKASGDSIRVWVPGCASGEECYSWVILLAEILGNSFASYDVHIIGSDLNMQAIAVAEKGCYSQTALRDVEPDIIARYFDNNGQDFKVKPVIRQACHFHFENVIENQLLQVDAISCRNLLIYMKSELQDKLIRKFYDCLHPLGLLFLGQSETIGLIGNTLFLPLDHYHRVYRRKKN